MTTKEALKLIKTELCPIRCEGENNMDECKAKCEFKEAVETLEQEPCEDAISRKDVLKGKIPAIISGQAIDVIPVLFIKQLPPVQPERRTGHWIPCTISSGRDSWECSICGRRARGKLKNLPYCHCGAKMEVGD